MAEFVTQILTTDGPKLIDYNALANKPLADTTLTQAGSFADAQAVGEMKTQFENDMQELSTNLQELSSEVTDLTPEDIGALNTENVVNNLITDTEGYALDARQGAELARQVAQKASTARYQATLIASGWSSKVPYTQTVNVEGILLTDDPFVDVDMGDVTSGDSGMTLLEAWSFVGRVTANEGNITAYCYDEKPTVDIPLVLKVVR